MKTIKQKAEEHAPYTENDSWNSTQKCIIAQTSFEAGANYVIDEIEYILEDKDLDCEDICDQLRILVKQLKK